MKKILLTILAGALSVGALLGIIIILFGLWNELTGKVLATTAVIFGFSISGLCCSLLYDKGKLRIFSLISMIICLCFCLYYLTIVWGLFDITFNSLVDFHLKVVLSSIVICPSLAHISLLLLINSEEDIVAQFKYATIFASVVMDIILLVRIVYYFEVIWQLVAILGILIALGTIVTPIMYKIHKYTDKPKKEVPVDDKYQKLEQLKHLYDTNVLSEEEYNAEKAKILNG